MNDDVLIFVYGTLRSDDPSGKCGLMRRYGGEPIGKAAVTGTLVDLGAYPAMLASGDGKVSGEVWQVPREAIPGLDRYEGYAYRRTVVEVGEARKAYAYVLDEIEVDPSPYPVIACGDWIKHREALAGLAATNPDGGDA